MIRAITADDLPKIKAIHEKYYNSQFELPNFLDHYLCAFVVEDNEGSIITVGGVRTITEAVALTDLDKMVRERRQGLMELFPALRYVNAKYGYKELHAFVQDGMWEYHLNKVGFKNPKGNALRVET